MKIRIAALIPVLLVLSCCFPLHGSAETPLKIQLAGPQGQTFRIGIFAPDLKVVIKNTGSEAIVLRSVHWDDSRDEDRPWVAKRYGSTTEGPDHTIEYNQLTQTLTQHAFESGLLFPKEELVVPVPMTPQLDGKHKLVVKYVVIGPQKDWANRILLPHPPKHGARILFSGATEERIKARFGRGTGDAIVRFSGIQGGLPPVEREVAENLSMRLFEKKSPVKRGELSSLEAAEKVGLDPRKDRYFAFWREELKAWFFILPDRTAVALRWEVPPTAPDFQPSNFKWKRHLMPKMDRTVPKDFKDRTLMLLHPDIFGDRVQVQTPGLNMYYDPGATSLAPHELWRVLERAQERGIEVRSVVIDPNGLGVERILAAGVAVDSSGRWIDPKIEPKNER